jgi:transaldolase/glucose-6-phosphate isomerase
MTTFAGPVMQLPSELASAVAAALADWTAKGGTRRLWARDASLWTNHDEARWLGWLDIAGEMLADRARLADAAETAKGFGHVVVLGMGGSSLCPDVLARTFGAVPGRPRLLIVDSTDPAQVRRIEASIDLANTLFVVASKSGSTLEPNIFLQHFLDRVRAKIGTAECGSRFVAITDPGSKVEGIAKTNGFRRVYHGLPTIGGRYSALSAFGMVPAAAMGLDVARLLERARAMTDACREPDAARNPGVALGVALGVLAKRGRDKMTIFASPGLAAIGAWLEQLVAESTGKLGRAIIPVDGETLAAPAVYGDDRVFVHVRLVSAPDAAQDAGVAKLAAAGHPVLRIDVADAMDLGAEFFRWEFATAVAGSILGIHPFDQPDVEASKVETKKLTSAFEAEGSLPAEKSFRAAGALSFFADHRNEEALAGAPTSGAIVAAHFARLTAGDYFALLLYVDMNAEHEAIAQQIRLIVRDRRRVATCVGFGPRFLHSTGQAYKGGPDSGVFLQVTCDDARDLPVPGQKYTFGVVKAAQARGDFAVLAERGRRALRVHVTGDVAAGLRTLRDFAAAARP